MRGVLLACVVLVAVAGRSEIVDRISIRVGNKMITASEINQRVRLTAFQNGQSADLTLARRKEAGQKLVDQRLVEREMEVGHYPRLTSSEASDLLVAYAAEKYGGNAGALGAALKAYGLTAANLEEDLARQEDLLSFLGLRFRLGNDETKADADLEAWVKDQRDHTIIEYLEKELAP